MLKAQLEHFYYSLLLHGMKKSKKPENWLEAFYMLEKFLNNIDGGTLLRNHLESVELLLHNLPGLSEVMIRKEHRLIY